MRKIYINIIVLFIGLGSLKAQSDLSFYHLGKEVPQGNHMNPAFFPDAKFYVSLPGISGVQFGINNSFGYEDVFTKISDPNPDYEVLLDVEKLLGKLENGDFLEMNTNVSLFQFGLRVGQSSFITVFANHRISSGMVFPLELLNFAWKGNAEFAGKTFVEEDFKLNYNQMNEYGVGYSQELSILGGKKLRIGARVKMLQGLANIQTSDDLAIRISTDAENSDISVSISNPDIFTAGLDSTGLGSNNPKGYIMSNANTGIGFDIGADFQLNEKINLTLAINDIGSISWSESIQNYTVNNTDIIYEGLDLKNTDDLGGAFSDTLSAKFNDEENTIAYKTNLDTRTFIGGSYQVFPKGRISASIANKFILGKAVTTFGAGYTHRFGKAFTASATIAKKARQKPIIGGAFAVRAGFFQLYAALDNAFGLGDVTSFKNMDLRFGINFLFGRNTAKKSKSKTSSEEVITLDSYEDN